MKKRSAPSPSAVERCRRSAATAACGASEPAPGSLPRRAIRSAIEGRSNTPLLYTTRAPRRLAVESEGLLEGLDLVGREAVDDGDRVDAVDERRRALVRLRHERVGRRRAGLREHVVD